MGVDVAPFEGVVVRSNLPALIANDGIVNVPIGAAPGANSIYYVVYARQNESQSPFADANDNAVFGFAASPAAPSPSLAAALANVPAGGLPLASVLVPSTATTTQSAGVIITQLYVYTAAAGGVVWCRNAAERDAFTWVEGQEIYLLDTKLTCIRSGTSWSFSSMIRLRPTSAPGGTLRDDGRVTFAGAAAVSMVGLPTADFEVIRFVSRITAKSVGSNVKMLLRSGGTDETDPNYSYHRNYQTGNALTNPILNPSVNFWELEAGVQSRSLLTVDLAGMGQAAATDGFVSAGSFPSLFTTVATLTNSETNAYDGATLGATSGTISGWWAAFGIC